MGFRSYLKTSVVIVVVFSMAACEASKQTDTRYEKISNQLANLPDYHKPEPARIGNVTMAPILGLNMVRRTSNRVLPPQFSGKTFGWTTDRAVSLSEIAAHIASKGLPTRVNDRRPETPMPLAGGTVGPNAIVTTGNAASLFQGLGGMSMPTGIGNKQAIVPNFEGELEDFIHTLEPLFGVTAVYRDGALAFDAYQIVTCTVAAAPTLSSLTSEVSGATTGAAAGPTGSTSSQNTTTQAVLDVWKDIGATLKQIVTAPDVAFVSPAMRQVVGVVGYENARRLRSYCDQLDENLAPRIEVQATIVELTVSQDDDYGLNLAPLYTGINGLQIGLSGVAPQLSGAAGAASVAVLPASQGGTSTHWAASQAIVRAASSAGKLAGVRNGTSIIQNGRSNTINLTTRQDYVKNYNFSNGTATAVPSTGTQTDTINYGFSMQILAHLTGQNRINIHANVTVSDLAALVDKPVGPDASVQLATVPNRAFDTDILLGSGETLVVAGNEQARVRRDKSGVISPDFFALGGSNRATLENTRLLLFLTATRMAEPSRNSDPIRAIP